MSDLRTPDQCCFDLAQGLCRALVIGTILPTDHFSAHFVIHRAQAQSWQPATWACWKIWWQAILCGRRRRTSRMAGLSWRGGILQMRPWRSPLSCVGSPVLLTRCASSVLTCSQTNIFRPKSQPPLSSELSNMSRAI